MKRIFVAILFALSVSTSSASFAAANPTTDDGQTSSAVPASVTFSQVEKSKLDVVVANALNANLTIQLTDATGKIIANKHLPKKETGTRVRFNLTKLNDGVYSVRVSNGQHEQVKKFEIKTTAPTETYQEVTFI